MEATDKATAAKRMTAMAKLPMIINTAERLIELTSAAQMKEEQIDPVCKNKLSTESMENVNQHTFRLELPQERQLLNRFLLQSIGFVDYIRARVEKDSRSAL